MRATGKPIEAKIREFTYAFGPVVLLIVVWLGFCADIPSASKKSPAAEIFGACREAERNLGKTE